MNAPEEAAVRLPQGPPRVGRQFASLVVAQATAATCAFVISVLLARQLGPELFGQFALFIAVAAAFSVPLNWVPSLIVVLGQEDLLRHGDARRSLGAIGLATFAMSALVLAVITISREPLARWSPGLAEMTGLLSLYVITSAAISIGLGSLQAEGRLDLYSAMMSARAIVPVVMLAALFAVTTVSLEGAILAIIAGQATGFAPFILRWLRRLRSPVLDPQWLRLMMRQGAAYLVGATQVFVVGYVDIIVLAAIATPVVVGEYGLAARIYQLLVVIAFVPATIALPIVNRYRVSSDDAATSAYLARSVPHLMTGGFLVAGLVSTGAGIALPLIFGTPFAPAVAPLSVLMVSLAVVIGRAGVSPILSAYLMILPASIAVTAGAVTLILAAVALGTRLGAIGVAIAVTLAAFVELAFILRITSRRFSVSWRARLLAPMAAGTGLIVLPPQALPNMTLTILMFAIALSVFVAAVRFAALFNVDEAARVGRIFGSGSLGETIGAVAKTLAVNGR